RPRLHGIPAGHHADGRVAGVGGRARTAHRCRVRRGSRLDDAMTAALSIDGVSYAYPDGRAALRGVDLTIMHGGRVELLGPNGAGKSTLALPCNGILEPATGTVTVAGLRVDKHNLAEIRRRVGIVFQDPDDQLFMATARDDVAFGPANAGIKGSEL